MEHPFIHLFICSLIGTSIFAEFRFCYNGPQRIRDSDCPGGFYAKKPINVTCAHYALTEETIPEGSTPQVVENYCESGAPVDLPLAGGEVSVKELQEFILNLGDAAAAPAPVGNFTPEGVCQEECLADWIDPNVLQPEDHLQDKPFNNASADIEEEEREVTKNIFMGLILDTTFEEDDPEGLDQPYDPLWTENATEPRLIRLLAQSMQIAWGNCRPYVEDSFLRQVLKAMLRITNQDKKGAIDIGLDEFNVITNLLTNCQAMANTAFRLKGPDCETVYFVDAIEYLRQGVTWKYRIQPRSFVWGMYDPMVEAAWAVVDFVHGYCFPAFIDDVPHHHMYTIAMEALFPPYPVQQHWLNPIEFKKGDAIWNAVFETGDIKIAMRNLDACAIAGYAVSPYRHRLERPFTPEELLADPTYAPVDSEKGWTKSMSQYWSYYEAQGGFRGRASEWGYCVQDPLEPEAKQEMSEEMKNKACNPYVPEEPSPP